MTEDAGVPAAGSSKSVEIEKTETGWKVSVNEGEQVETREFSLLSSAQSFASGQRHRLKL